MDIKVSYTIEGFTFEAVLSTKEDKNEFLKQMKYMKQDLLEKGLITGEPVGATAVQPETKPVNKTEDGPLSQKQYDYLINLGAYPEDICNLSKSDATKLIHDIKRKMGWE